MKTNRKKIILFILIALVLIVGAVWFFMFFNRPADEGEGAGERNLFPFGEILPGLGFGNEGSQGTTDGGSTGGGQSTEDQVVQELGAQLRLINDVPTAGAVSLIRVEEKEVITAGVDEEGNPTQEVKTIEVENQFVRYSNIEDGSVYETQITGDTPFSKELIVENFIPNTEFSNFSPKGNSVSFQYWDHDNRVAETYLGSIRPLIINPEICPYDFNGPIIVGKESESVFDIHRFLNQDLRTQIARRGVNSPGNEATLASEATIQAIEKFQTVHNLDVDGALGPQTRGQMLTVCNEQQQKAAEAELEKRGTKYEISGFFLPQNIISINMDPQGKEVFYLEKDPSGATGTLRNLSDQTRRTIFTSPYSQWTSYWENNNQIEISSKPSYASDGFSYSLEVNGGDYHKSFKQRKGLMTKPSHDDSKILVHDVESGRSRLSIYERSTSRFIPLSIETFPDKCVWSSDDSFIYCAVPDALAYGQEYPDVWYQGLETYQDSLFRINTTSRQEELLSNISVDYGEGIDVEYMYVDGNDQYLYFIDKNTEYLWSYRVDEV